MRRSGQPSRPSAMTCCRFSSLKTLLTSMEGNPSIVLNVLPFLLAGFQLSLIGRFWVSPEGTFVPQHEGKAVSVPHHRWLLPAACDELHSEGVHKPRSRQCLRSVSVSSRFRIRLALPLKIPASHFMTQ